MSLIYRLPSMYHCFLVSRSPVQGYPDVLNTQRQLYSSFHYSAHTLFSRYALRGTLFASDKSGKIDSGIFFGLSKIPFAIAPISNKQILMNGRFSEDGAHMSYGKVAAVSKAQQSGNCSGKDADYTSNQYPGLINK